jgi:hypothetical protein
MLELWIHTHSRGKPSEVQAIAEAFFICIRKLSPLFRHRSNPHAALPITELQAGSKSNRDVRPRVHTVG